VAEGQVLELAPEFLFCLPCLHSQPKFSETAWLQSVEKMVPPPKILVKVCGEQCVMHPLNECAVLGAQRHEVEAMMLEWFK
jgi:hypothetical protein